MGSFSHRLLCSCAAITTIVSSDAALSQTALPEVVVNSPTPIKRRPTPVAQPEPGAPAQQTPPAVADDATVLPPGVQPVVTDSFSAVTVVTKEELDRNGGRTLGDLLLEKPGITGSSFAPGSASRPIIRGLDNFRVRIQENGLVSGDVSDLGEDHGVPIDPFAAQQVEVIRGPATLRYGSGAIGGVVDITNNRIPTFVPRRPSVEVRGSTESVDTSGDGAIQADGGAGNFAYHADAFGRNAQDYRIPGGVQTNSATHSTGASAGGSYVTDKGYIGIAVTQFNSAYSIPGIEPTQTRTRIELNQTKVQTKGEIRDPFAGIDAIRFTLGLTDYRHDEKGDDPDGIYGLRATFINRQQEGRVETQLTPFDLRFATLTTAVGVQFGHQALSAGGEGDALLAPNETLSAAAYVFNELKLTDTLKLQAAGRIETVSVRGTAGIFPGSLDGADGPVTLSDRQREFNPASGSLGLLKELGFGVVGTINGSYVERAPRAPELFSKGAHDAPGTFEIGDPDLKIESAKTVEVGLKKAKGAWRFDTAAYYTQFQNFIFKRLTGLTCGDDFDSCGSGGGTDFKQIVYSQRDATFTGVEVATQLDVVPLGPGLFGVDAQYDAVRAQFQDGSNVPRIPPQRLGGGVFWRSDNWFARVGLLHAFAQRNTGELETETNGYNNLKAEVSYTTKYSTLYYGFSEATVGLVGNNLLDEDIRNSVSFRKDEVQLPGRSVRLFARLRF